MIDQVKAYLLSLQQDICDQLEQVDGKASFIKDEWQKPDNSGNGITRVLTNGTVFEQAGVNFSIVHGDNMPASATQLRPELAGRSFSALGVSLVIHPLNPYAPTSHANVRFFIAEKDGEDPIWWFGVALISRLIMALMKMQFYGIKPLKMLATLLAKTCIQNTKNGAMIIFT